MYKSMMRKRYKVIFIIFLLMLTFMWFYGTKIQIVDTIADRPIPGAKVVIKVKVYIPGPGHSTSYEIKTITKESDVEGISRIPLWVHLFTFYVYAEKEGYTYPDVRFQERLPLIYLVPVSEAVMQKLELLLLSASSGQWSSRATQYIVIIQNYEEAKKLAKTEREREFLKKFCEVANQQYSHFSLDEIKHLESLLNQYHKSKLSNC